MTTSPSQDPLDSGAAARPITVAVTGEPELVVHGLRAMLLRTSTRLRLVDPSLAADLLLYDSTRIDGDQLAELLARCEAPDVRFAEFGWRTDPACVRQARARGAAGYVYKGLEAPILARTIEKVADGDWTAPLLEEADAHTSKTAAGVGDRYGLSAREAEMLFHIARGLSNHEIASHTYLSINSVKTYIRTAYRKIGVSRRPQAVRWAIEHGLVDMPDVVPAEHLANHPAGESWAWGPAGTAREGSTP
jgi:NarL family two-component system response regulator LiaR